EHAVLDLVPLRGSWRVVTDRHLEARLLRELGELELPQPDAMSVGSPGIGGDEQLCGLWEAGPAHGVPPAPDRFDGEAGGVGRVADRHPSLVVGEVVDPVGDGPAELFVDEVMGLHPRRFADRVVLPAAVGELAHQLLLLGVHAYDWL